MWMYFNSSFGTSGWLSRNLDSHSVPPSKLPSSKNNRWVVLKPAWEGLEYTVKHLPFPKTGGRGPNGKLVVWFAYKVAISVDHFELNSISF